MTPAKLNDGTGVFGMKAPMVTLNAQAAVLAEASVAVQVVAVVPTEYGEPLTGLQAAVAPGQLSDTVGGG